jgi:hypothetical protein
VQIKERLPDVAVAIWEGRTNQVFGWAPGRLGDLVKVFAERDAFLVRLGKFEVMLRVVLQCAFCGSKKSATFPIAALT